MVDLAADLGAGLVLYVCGWQVYGTTRAQAFDWTRAALVEVARHAADRGITIAIEPTSADSNLIDTADHALELMRVSGQSNVKVMFDTFHALYRNEVSADYVRAMGPDLVHVHFADRDRLPPGEGVIDWQGVLQALKDLGFRGHATMEIGFNTRAVDPDRIARSALAHLKRTEALLA